MSDPATSMHFNVKIDGIELGTFTGFDGIGAEYEVLSHAEGGENTFVHQLPGRLKYTNVKLTRAVDEHSILLSNAFHLLSKGLSWGVRHILTVTARNPDGDVIAEWIFDGAFPAKYTGPSLTVETGKVATETFEFSHHGLMPGVAQVSAGVEVVGGML